jgi:hypothetical protein
VTPLPLSRISRLCSSENSFEMLLFIFNTILQNQDEAKSKDFRYMTLAETYIHYTCAC